MQEPTRTSSSVLERFRLDLGIRTLLPEWRKLLNAEHLRADVLAGLTVACIAVPLSLAIALASGVTPAIGLVTAIVSGVIGAFFGGTTLAVTGPAAAMAILVSTVVQQHGVAGLLMVTLGCGLLQLVTGVVGLGRLVRFVPVPVIAGFTAGIGAIIFIGQLPRALGLPPPDQSHVFDVIAHLSDYIHKTHPVALGLALCAVAICVGLPKLWPRLPAPLIAVVVPTAVVAGFGLDAPAVGDIPRTLPMPSLPGLPSGGSLSALFTATLMVYALASLETLLSSTALDKLAGGKRHNPDQELVGQGLANMAVSLFGGIPVTGVIARSALNAQAGAKTRRSAIIHSIALMGMVFFLGSIIARIPLAALAGVLLAVALRMMNLAEFRQIWRTSRSEGSVYTVTFVVIVLGDLIAGVQVGLGLAFLIAAIRLGQTKAALHEHGPGQSRLYLKGALTFLSSSSLDPLRKTLSSPAAPQRIVIDLSELTLLDVSGAEMLSELVEMLEERKTHVALVGMPSALEPILRGSDPDGFMLARLARSEADIERLLHLDTSGRPLDRLVRGVARFRAEMSSHHRGLFESLADIQQPHTLFITCCDSRIVPSMITSTDPGELFLVRNVGNVVPPFGEDGIPAEGAAVEYAVSVLGVKEIIVCGHSGCGAMKALISGIPKELPSLRRWLEHARGVRALKEKTQQNPTPEEAAQLNALIQLEHLTTYPTVRQRVATGELRLHAWHYDIPTCQLLEWSEEAAGWMALQEAKVPEAGVQNSASTGTSLPKQESPASSGIA